ncbi:glycoside hydrolase family 3 N-terminal domain-containing protein [Sulfurimonas sp. C5]|uniref:glycoside hydrolase family 3 N-terminal domain-containing protein n=1 Tax=Sulfurimonas sp. C5 TaxID=3036947 RepID=UPI0024582EA9|nr:glycoside hydrolase family 3 N-terminal domain-containing protein [Sulfurimonas sp. C5]MDH4944323.1 glycoside hydrolase family 3 N-terminal domain-containing protein [Sulfurimonas sp. C5]
MKLLLSFLLLFLSLHADVSDTQLKDMIAKMLIVGFEGEQTEQKYKLGGVILFDKNLKEPQKTKNIISVEQLTQLTNKIKTAKNAPLFISIDQEGGKVARLKEDRGFSKAPSAKEVATFSLDKVHHAYQKQSQMLHRYGFNMNFAPVVDLNLNPDNKVIAKLERSYGKTPKEVVKYASIMIEEQNKAGIVSVLKHFPGHGSSLEDSHKGFVDITNTWQEKELEPYKELIVQHKVDVIMTAHVFNKKLDPTYPATLSYKINTKLLCEQLGFKGVIVSDDMQMKAISEHYSLKEAVTLAINSGVDMLLFGNQLGTNTPEELVETVFKQVKNHKIPLQRILDSNKKIDLLAFKSKLVQKPIIFTNRRITMTKEYIKQHYGKNVENIRITPEMIVLHWTAVIGFEDSYKRLYQEELFTDRKDIASASLLNVSAHFLVDRDGTIYQLMPDNWMARHVIGLNYSTIGVENVGGEGNKKEDLTPAQVKSNIALVRYLKAKYPTINYLIGHQEYREFENTPLWLERDKGYRTEKADPGEKFMNAVRSKVHDLGLKSRYE